MNIVRTAETSAITETARELLARYEDRDGLTGNPDWDLVMAAKLSASVDALLGLVEKLAGE